MPTLDKSRELNENWCIELDSCIWDLSIARKFWWHDKKQHIVLYKMKLRKLQANVVIYTKSAENSATRLKNWFIVRESEHFICYAKFEVVDLFDDWIVDNLEGLSYFCNFSSCDLLCALLPEFAGFCDHLKGVGGLVIECREKLGILKSNCDSERGARVASFRSGL